MPMHPSLVLTSLYGANSCTSHTDFSRTSTSVEMGMEEPEDEREARGWRWECRWGGEGHLNPHWGILTLTAVAQETGMRMEVGLTSRYGIGEEMECRSLQNSHVLGLLHCRLVDMCLQL
jgi:hypothetical protein